MSLRIRMDQFLVPLSAEACGPASWTISAADTDEVIGKLTQLDDGKWIYSFRNTKLRKKFTFGSRKDALATLASDERDYRRQLDPSPIVAPVGKIIKHQKGPAWKPTGWPVGALSKRNLRHLMTKEQRDALVEQQRARRRA